MSEGMQQARFCAYCPTPLVSPRLCSGTLPPNAATRDHIIPRWLVRRDGLGAQPQRWHCRNCFWYCAACNQAKAGLHPLEWLQRLHSTRRERLAVRLVALGVPAEAVARARVST